MVRFQVVPAGIVVTDRLVARIPASVWDNVVTRIDDGPDRILRAAEVGGGVAVQRVIEKLKQECAKGRGCPPRKVAKKSARKASRRR